MHADAIHIIDGGLTGDAPLDTAISRAILEGVSAGRLPETLQVGLPHNVVAFGRHDALAATFSDAVAIAVAHGYDPTIRIAGGRAVVFHPHTVRFAWTMPVEDPVREMQERFRIVAQLVIDTLAQLGVESSMGELPREYCPGKYSVYIPDAGKVMGAGQRLGKHAAQIAGMIVVNDRHSVNAVLEPIYEALGVDMDPAMTGSIDMATTADPDLVAELFIEQVGKDRDLLHTRIGETTLSAARYLRDDHDPRILA